MTEQKLISRLQTLKQIKPRKDWAFSVKMSILGSDTVAKKVPQGLNYKEVFSGILGLFNQRKLAYAFAAFLFMVFGFVGFSGITSNNENIKLVNQSPAALALFDIKNNIDEFKIKSQNLMEATNNNSENISLAVKEVKSAVKNLTDAIQKNPKIAKDIALELKNNGILASLEGGIDLKEISDPLHKVIIEQLMKDDENTTFNEVQQKVLLEVKGLYDQGKYSEALIKRFEVGN